MDFRIQSFVSVTRVSIFLLLKQLKKKNLIVFLKFLLQQSGRENSTTSEFNIQYFLF